MNSHTLFSNQHAIVLGGSLNRHYGAQIPL